MKEAVVQDELEYDMKQGMEDRRLVMKKWNKIQSSTNVDCSVHSTNSQDTLLGFATAT